MSSKRSPARRLPPLLLLLAGAAVVVDAASIAQKAKPEPKSPAAGGGAGAASGYNLKEKISEAHAIIFNGVQSVRDNLDQFTASNKLPKVDDRHWKQLNATLERQFSSIKERMAGRNSVSQQEAIWEAFVENFEKVSGSFVHNVSTQGAAPSSASGAAAAGDDPQRQSEQTIIVIVLEKGFGGIAKELKDLPNENLRSGSYGERSSQIPKTIFALLSVFTQTTPNPNGPAYDPNAPTSQRPLQVLAGQIGQAISNLGVTFRPPPSVPSEAPPAVAQAANATHAQPPAQPQNEAPQPVVGGGGSGQRPLQALAGQISQAINNLAAFRPETNESSPSPSQAAAAGGAAGAPGAPEVPVPSSSQRPFQVLAGQISQAIQQINQQFRPSEEDDDEEDTSGKPPGQQKPTQKPQQTTKRPKPSPKPTPAPVPQQAVVAASSPAPAPEVALASATPKPELQQSLPVSQSPGEEASNATAVPTVLPQLSSSPSPSESLPLKNEQPLSQSPGDFLGQRPSTPGSSPEPSIATDPKNSPASQSTSSSRPPGTSSISPSPPSPASSQAPSSERPKPQATTAPASSRNAPGNQTSTKNPHRPTEAPKRKPTPAPSAAALVDNSPSPKSPTRVQINLPFVPHDAHRREGSSTPSPAHPPALASSTAQSLTPSSERPLQQPALASLPDPALSPGQGAEAAPAAIPVKVQSIESFILENEKRPISNQVLNIITDKLPSQALLGDGADVKPQTIQTVYAENEKNPGPNQALNVIINIIYDKPPPQAAPNASGEGEVPVKVTFTQPQAAVAAEAPPQAEKPGEAAEISPPPQSIQILVTDANGTPEELDQAANDPNAQSAIMEIADGMPLNLIINLSGPQGQQQQLNESRPQEEDQGRGDADQTTLASAEDVTTEASLLPGQQPGEEPQSTVQPQGDGEQPSSPSPDQPQLQQQQHVHVANFSAASSGPNGAGNNNSIHVLIISSAKKSLVKH